MHSCLCCLHLQIYVRLCKWIIGWFGINDNDLEATTIMQLDMFILELDMQLDMFILELLVLRPAGYAGGFKLGDFPIVSSIMVFIVAYWLSCIHKLKY